ncbi:MAG: UDP-N-acetylmuramate dehydrogenase [Lachnospiraceae bacterium]|nr:UDP-N-acetylmuramate dehydrogenase [Lachnospiraceae bacterium]
MSVKELYRALYEIVGEDNIIENEPLAKHTTFRIGGPARYFLTPDSEEALKEVILMCKEHNIDFYVIGNGSNLLVSDKGYDGVVIKIGENLRKIRCEEDKIYATAGATLAGVAQTALKNSLTGFEFAAGIPGTLGGALVMNAGAYGGEMKLVVESAEVLDNEGNFIVLSNEELELGYRKSVIPKKGYIVLSAVIKLDYTEDKEAISARMSELAAQRREKQPLEYPSAGSTFKRPEGYFAGKLIMDAGLRGYAIGGATVSEKHCGFVINKGGATADDVIRLIEHVRATVLAKFGVELEPEVKLLGF